MTTTQATKPPTTSARKSTAPKIRKNIPAPNTPAGAIFLYRSEEAAQWTPFTARTLRDKAYKREIPFTSGGGVYFTGAQILEIVRMYAVRPISETKSAA